MRLLLLRYAARPCPENRGGALDAIARCAVVSSLSSFLTALRRRSATGSVLSARPCHHRRQRRREERARLRPGDRTETIEGCYFAPGSRGSWASLSRGQRTTQRSAASDTPPSGSGAGAETRSVDWLDLAR
jgi:hypothetical protein